MRDPVNLHIPQYFHVFSTREIHPGYGDRAANGSKQHATILPSASGFAKTPMNRRTPTRKTENWEKILVGGPCFEGTLQKLTSCF